VIAGPATLPLLRPGVFGESAALAGCRTGATPPPAGTTNGAPAHATLANGTAPNGTVSNGAVAPSSPGSE
jgi:hypothetical protein